MTTRIAVADSYFTVPREALSASEWKRIIRSCSYVAADGLPYECVRPRKRDDAVRLPRGAWAFLPEHVRYRDRRAFPELPELKLNEDFKLDATLPDGRSFEGQAAAVKSMFAEEQGLILRPPGSGKTQIAVAFMAKVGTRCLVLVHTEDILDQWHKYLIDAGISESKIGLIRGDTRRVRQITLAMVQTFYQDMLEEPETFRDAFGCVIVDEAHHAPANTWEVILNNLTARYRFGLTASPTRADGHHPYIRLLIGPVIHKQQFHSKVKVRVEVVKTDFNYRYRGSWDWGNLLRALVTDDERNETIAGIVRSEIQRGASILVLSRRIEHLERIAEFVGDGCEILTARRSSADRKRILADFRAGRVRAVLATQLADEALDVPILSRVVLTHPGKAEGRIIQQIGRAIREHPLKSDAVIYDIYDRRVGVLRRQFAKRKAIYHKMKLKVKGAGISWR